MIRIRVIYEMIKNKAITFFLSRFSSLNLSKGVLFKNLPLILKHHDAKITIGYNTTINSSNFGYHINMHSKCKLYADRPYALINIGDNCRIHGTCIHSYKSIEIGNNVLIGANTQIIDGNGHELSFENPANRINTTDIGEPITIKDNVWIGSNCMILGGTTIGKGTVIAANSVVKGIIPSMAIYGGNPAKLIKQY